MQIELLQTHHELADFDAIEHSIFEAFKIKQTNEVTLIVGPELLLCGYPLQDLCLQKLFISKYLMFLENLEIKIQNMPKNPNLALIAGGLEYDYTDSNQLSGIYNVLYLFSPGSLAKKIYRKILLPNYDIFDEKKYFSPGTEPGYLEWNGFNFGLMICEDMWADDKKYQTDPCHILEKFIREKKIKLDAIINCSASPYHVGKKILRQKRAIEIISIFHCPFIYINRVGQEDEILFDGQSFIQESYEKAILLERFKTDSYTYTIKKNTHNEQSNDDVKKSFTTWLTLFKPDLSETSSCFHPELKLWSDDECAEVIHALQFGIQEYAKKFGFKKFIIGLSGGIDSGLVLALLKLTLNPHQQIEPIFMPGLHSSELSLKLAQEICQNFSLNLKHLPIKFLHTINRNLFKEHLGTDLTGIAEENIQSRLRGMLLYTRSNQTDAMVVNTSNKSELAVGYSTQYGDSVGAISLIGDLFKSHIYRLSQFINNTYGLLIPEAMINRPPTAELRPNQTDEQSLISYKELDPLLECILSYEFDIEDLLNMGFQKESVKKVLNLYQASEYKRRQFCPIIKVRPKSFGFGYRVPICKSRKMYTIID